MLTVVVKNLNSYDHDVFLFEDILFIHIVLLLTSNNTFASNCVIRKVTHNRVNTKQK